MNTNSGRLRRALTAGLVTATTVATPIAVGAEPVAGFTAPDFHTVAEDSDLGSLDNFFDVLLNDVTGPFSPTSVASYTQGTKGSVGAVLSAEGATIKLTYVPEPNVFGTDEFTYTVGLEDGSFETQTVTVTITPSQDDPVAGADDLADTVIVENGDPVDILAAVLANDVDVDNDFFTVASVNTEGTLGNVFFTPMESEGAPAVLTYEATSDSATTDSFTYVLTDTNGNESAPATVNLTIVPTDDAPVVEDDGVDPAIALDEDSSVLIDVVANDTDADGEPVIIDPDSITVPTNGTAVLEGNKIRYTHDGSETIDDSFNYGVVGGGTATVSLVINPADDAPHAVNDGAEGPFAVVSEGGSVTLDVLGNDTDVDRGPLEVTAITGVPEGHAASVITEGDDAGKISYTHGGNDLADVTFSYEVNGGSTASVWIAVTNSDDDPFTVAPVPTVEIDEDADGTTISVLTDGQVDVDGTELALAAIGTGDDAPVLGTAELVDVDGVTTLVYTPSDNANGEDTFTVVVSDGNEEHDVAVVITVDIAPMNDAPVASGDDFTNESAVAAEASETGVLVLEDTTTFLPLLLNDSDIDNDSLAVDLSGADLDPEVGTLEVVDGGVNFTPAENFFGSFSFDYHAIESDTETPLTSEPVTVNVTVVAQPDAVVAGDDQAEVNEDFETYLSVLENDVDPDGFDLEVVSATQPDDGYVVVIGNEIRVEPDTDFHGEMEFTYTVKPSARIDYTEAGVVEIPCDDEADCETTTATVTVTVTPMNDVPVAKADNGIETDEDTAISIDVLDNDTDIDGDDLEIRFLGTPSLGSVEIVDGEILYTPTENVYGTDSFTYNAFDGFALATSSVSITINPVDDAPTIEDVETTGTEDTDVVLELTVNDVDPDNETLTISVGEVTGGSASAEGTTLTFTPAENFVGTALIPLTVTDDDELTGQAIVTIEVGAVNDVPVIDDEDVETDEDEAVLIDMSFSDVEDDQLTIVIGEAPSNGTAIIDGDKVLYTPADDFYGEDTFTVTTTDSEGAEATATVTVEVASINDIPVIADEEASTDEDTPVTIPMTFSDIEDDDLEIQVGYGLLRRVAAIQIDGEFDGDFFFFGQPMYGTAEVDGSNIIYTPQENFYGEDSFVVTTVDSNGAMATALVTVTVASVNDAPVINDATVDTDEDEAVFVPISVTDVEDGPFWFEDEGEFDDDDFPAPPRLVITEDVFEEFEGVGQITITDAPANGTAQIGPGGVLYTPEEDFNGQDSFTVSTTDSDGATSTATITVNVASVNDKPDIDDAEASTDEDTSVTIPMTFSDDEDELIIEIGDAPINGTAVIDGDNVIYTPDDNFYGEDTFTVTTHDSERKLGKADVTVTVGSVNDLPLIDNNSASTDAGEAVSVPMSFSDVEDDSLTIEIGEGPRYGTAVADNGNVVYTPAEGFSGEDSFTVTTTDSAGATATATVTITVTAPVVVEVNPYIGADAVDGQVVRIYSAMLGRTPDAGGFAFWVEARNSGMSLARMIEMFADSPEFKATFGNRMTEDTNEEWVDFVYSEIMGRTPDAGGRAFWLNMLETGEATRSWMVVAFAESPEFQALTQTS